MHATYLPGAQRKRFGQKKWPREVFFSGPPILVAGSTAAKRQHPIGVIYLDSSDRALFERDDVVEIVGVGTKAISDFVTKRY